MRKTPVFVIHYKPLVERKAYLDYWFFKNQIEPNWIVDGQKEDMTPNIINKYYEYNPSVYDRKLSLSEIGCTIGHMSAYKMVLEKKYPYALIFEDDVCLPDDFASTFDSLMANCPTDFDVVSLGTCCGMKYPHTSDEQRFYRVIPPLGRCGYAQLISNRACGLAIKYSTPFHFPADWQYYNIASNNTEHQFITYWIEPPIAFEGSKIGKYNSSIR
jgi:glycosyl transferase family 25